ncbi:hypothetical protein BV25DRAFT_1813850 [Artomyces pyxidatus]|uniref:Uncharacterized protein n=1 Tax=Artomyces pyxidatus TaxID=48021 RepID=A0ACB8SJK4_9AGAM|nr:hypothetical protein BV25DRAFT_1813850 [Artomyces pyxidatus]
MLKRWRESEWGRMWKNRKQGATETRAHWVGGSFEIGDFIGVNVLNGEPPKSLRSPASSRFTASVRAHTRSGIGLPSAATQDSFVTARSHMSERSAVSSPPDHLPTVSSSPDNEFPPIAEEALGADSSSTSLLRPPGAGNRIPSKTRTEIIPRHGVPRQPLSQTQSDGILDGARISSFLKDKGKGKVVRMQEEITEPEPAPPAEVLERTGSEIQDTSASASIVPERTGERSTVTFEQEAAHWGDVVLQDRMIVRVCYSSEDNLGSHFDEHQHRSAQNLQSINWAEFMVAWRKDRIELYEDYTLPFKESFVGHKHLSFIIPLKNVGTKLSLYSFVDMTFCITCPPTSVHTGPRTRMPFHRKSGTNVFLFKVKCRSRAVDWIWHLWRHLGGQLPSKIEIRSPVLDTSVKIDVPKPAEGEEVDYAIFSRDNLVNLCCKTLNHIPDYEFLLQRRLAEGARLELAWRMDTKLDWVWWQDDVDDNHRRWAVLAGLALCQAGKAAHLEIRVGEHLPTHLHLKDGRHLSEPPAIEGYVERIKPTSQTRQALYLTVHNGLLFTLPPSRAHPPHPPGTVPPPIPADEDYYATLRLEEVRRGAAQVAEARGVTDLRTVVAVRRAFQTVPVMNENVQAPERPEWDDDELLSAAVERDASDETDIGGEEGLAGVDRPHGRMRRCFELVMKTGRVIRFETYSAKVAIEWIERLRELIRYWKMRHFIDTRQEMDIVHFATGRTRITPHRVWNDEERLRPPEPTADPSEVLPYLSSLYNWCVFDGCRPITKTGRIYVRKGLRGQYKLVQLFLVAGHLVQYHIKSGSIHHRRKGKTINLVDAYTASGVFAAQALPVGQYSPNLPATARRYQDGLESDDLEADTLFVVYYYPHTVGVGNSGDSEKLPDLSSDRNLVVFRTRSRVERDVWCWALNTEIEKLARERRERERQLREAGGLVPL